ncbi:hypothetical protein GZH46_00650 [Fragariocoptes setiger]|uniref:HMG box domain-containing protein n=1 Tax=Fragariocoptes setiger TaxID=1670756 RepID=A0ABQ7SC20_9ACAR|nr:hypothetical protein GZH46_00650 [Fragariocoptes setiger]
MLIRCIWSLLLVYTMSQALLVEDEAGVEHHSSDFNSIAELPALFTPYGQFVDHYRYDKDDNDLLRSMGQEEFDKMCKDMWETADPEEKQSFQESANEANDYLADRHAEVPRPPRRGFDFFNEDFAKEWETISPEAQAKMNPYVEVHQRWIELSPEDMAAYEAKAKEDEARYEQEVAAYEKKREAQAKRLYTEQKSAATENDHLSCQKDIQHTKRPMSAFFWFCLEHRDEVRKSLSTDVSLGDLSKELSHRWNTMSASSKAKYETKASEDQARYEQELKDCIEKVRIGTTE